MGKDRRTIIHLDLAKVVKALSKAQIAAQKNHTKNLTDIMAATQDQYRRNVAMDSLDQTRKMQQGNLDDLTRAVVKFLNNRKVVSYAVASLKSLEQLGKDGKD